MEANKIGGREGREGGGKERTEGVGGVPMKGTKMKNMKNLHIHVYVIASLNSQ